MVETLASKYSARPLVLGEIGFDGSASYSKFGTEAFDAVVANKWRAILAALDRGYSQVVFSDCDIAVVRNFVPFLEAASAYYSCGVQSESNPVFPAHYCTGFMYFTAEARPFLESLSAVNLSNLHLGNDQKIFNLVVRSNKNLVRDILLLPESLFQNGLHFRTFLGQRFPDSGADLQPYIFHANFVSGIESKIRLLKYASLWFVPS
jgi:hypothetical protein